VQFPVLSVAATRLRLSLPGDRVRAARRLRLAMLSPLRYSMSPDRSGERVASGELIQMDPGETGAAIGADTHWPKAGWSWFNRWRRRYWKTRVLILLILCAPSLYAILTGDYPIVGLLRIAIKSIQLAHEPRHAWHLARYYRAEETRRLQTVLRLELDVRTRTGRRRGLLRGSVPSPFRTPRLWQEKLS